MMELTNLTPEQIEKAKACKTTDELAALAKSEGVELSDEELEAVSGGSWVGIHMDCSTFSCGAWDCSVHSCTTVNCTQVDCTMF